MNFNIKILQSTQEKIRIQAYKYFCEKDIQKYNISVDPYEQEAIDPTEITEWSRRPLPNHRDVIEMCGMVKTGNWDIRNSFEITPEFNREYLLDIIYDDVKISNTMFYQSMKNHFEKGVSWDETEYFQTIHNILQEEGSVVWSGERSSKEELLKRCREVDALYDSMAKNGFRTQEQLGRNRKHQLANEILVDISRDGRYLLVDGKHRLVIAQLLDLDFVTTTVLVRHKEWVESKQDKNNNQI